jgi:arylsulfatase A-like enzyme
MGQALYFGFDKMAKKKSWAFLPVLGLLILVVLYFSLARKNQPYHSPGSNIILISIDTLRADHLGCYGYAPPTTPRIDEFRRDAVLFEKCMAASSSTLASHASIMTSLIPAHHGAFFSLSERLPAGMLTMAEIFKDNGFRTASFNDGGQLAPEFGLDQGFDVYEHMDKDFPIDKVNFDRIVKKTEAWLDQNPEGRFFLFLHTYETHSPYTPKRALLDIFDKNYRGSLPPETLDDFVAKLNSGAIKISAEDKAHIVATYDAEIRSMDESFGALVGGLKARGLYDKTLIIFTSDHGEEFDEHGIMATHSHTLYNELIHVPLIVKFPQSKFASHTVKTQVRSIDILPTVLDVLSIPAPAFFEGVSLMPFVLGRRPERALYVVSERDMQQVFRSAFWSIMNERWKLYDSRLYDLAADPGETTDVSRAHPEVKLSLRRRALRFLEIPSYRPVRTKAKLDEETKKRLRGLGYVR